MSLSSNLKNQLKILSQIALESPLLLIHPQNPYAALLMAKLLDESQVPGFYYALKRQDKALTHFLENLGQALKAQGGDFGTKSQSLLKKAAEALPLDLHALAKAVAQDLADISSEPWLLVLDDFDQADAGEEVQPFIEALLDQLPAQVHLVVKSRQIPRLSWLILFAKKQAQIYRDSESLGTDFLGTKQKAERSLQASGFGRGSVIFQGREISDWEGTLPRQLLFFVLSHGRVSRAEICKNFWGDLSIEQAVNVFHVTKRRLHKALGFDTLVHEDELYMLSPQIQLSYDVLDFLDAILAARHAPDAPEHWQKAVKVYSGSFLQGGKEAWVQRYRSAFRNAWLEACFALAGIQLEKAQKEQALRTYLLIAAEDRLNETAQSLILQLYLDLGRVQEGIDHYRQLEKELKKTEQKIPKAVQTIYLRLAKL